MAMERRGLGDKLPALLQQSGISATPAPSVSPGALGGGLPMPTGGGVPAPAPEAAPQEISGAAAPAGSPEAELILKAMSDRLKHISKVEDLQLPQQPQF